MGENALKESMPIIEDVTILLLERAPIRHGVLSLEARQAEAAGSILAGEYCVGPAGSVRIALPRYIEHRSLQARMSLTRSPKGCLEHTLYGHVNRLAWVVPVERLELLLRERVVLRRRKIRACRLHNCTGVTVLACYIAGVTSSPVSDSGLWSAMKGWRRTGRGKASMSQ